MPSSEFVESCGVTCGRTVKELLQEVVVTAPYRSEMSLSLTHRKNLIEFVKTRCIHSASDDGRMEAFGAALP